MPPRDAGPGPESDAPQPKRPPAGLKQQAGTTKDAVVGLVRAHVDLAKAEASDIGDQVKAVAAGVGIAFAALLLLAFLLPIGLFLFVGEWLFGSLGWGLLHGVELLVLVATAAVLAALGMGRVARSIVLAFIAGAVVAVLLGTNAPNLLYTLIANQFGAGVDPGPAAFGIGAGIGAAICGIVGIILGARSGHASSAAKGLVAGLVLGAITGVVGGGLWRLAENEASRPMVVGILLVGGVLGLLGLVLGARSDGLSGAILGLVTGFMLGGAVGAFSAITVTWHVAIALGVSTFLGAATVLMLAETAAHGIDMGALKARFIPQATIDTTKETIEWAKARIPGAPKG